MEFVRIWMEEENIILREVIQSHKDKYHSYYAICRPWPVTVNFMGPSGTKY